MRVGGSIPADLFLVAAGGTTYFRSVGVQVVDVLASVEA